MSISSHIDRYTDFRVMSVFPRWSWWEWGAFIMFILAVLVSGASIGYMVGYEKGSDPFHHVDRIINTYQAGVKERLKQ